ncbi:hypothetical protein [Streptomyces rubrogriseus]|uniref:Uncharacterized protein n=1 Tax=Streptomyces rubrogriseus TaxID=194673 RepID=A0A6G3TS05_9ACTN|nr:hypothetical protein [Streptomyces rubrogriseus]NEC39529.1 hypothetical protein [Streptomyces rubrogriseus]
MALAVLRRACLGSVPPAALPPHAAVDVYATFVRFPQDSTRRLLVVAVVTALAAYPYGPGHSARAARRTAARVTSATGAVVAAGA